MTSSGVTRADFLNLGIAQSRHRRALSLPIARHSAKISGMGEILPLSAPLKVFGIVVGGVAIDVVDAWKVVGIGDVRHRDQPVHTHDLARPRQPDQIGRASCRESGCQYGSISVVAVSLKK